MGDRQIILWSIGGKSLPPQKFVRKVKDWLAFSSLENVVISVIFPNWSNIFLPAAQPAAGLQTAFHHHQPSSKDGKNY